MTHNPPQRSRYYSKVRIAPILIFCTCVALLPARCFADEVNVVGLDSPQTATPGETVIFTGAINNAIEDTPVAFTFSFSGFDPSELTPESLLATPYSIGGGATIDLFSVILSPTIAAGTYTVDYQLQGAGPDETRDADGVATIMVTPEPSTMWLMATGLIIFGVALAWFNRKKLKPSGLESV
jgi:PEP-CTERM motif